jgi:hypothetical protein
MHKSYQILSVGKSFAGLVLEIHDFLLAHIFEVDAVRENGSSARIAALLYRFTFAVDS